MEGWKYLRTIRLHNILSFGPDTPEFSLEPLNVLIGPNASGKSNFIEALSLLHSARRDIQTPIRQSGGAGDWIWKGPAHDQYATIEVTAEFPARPMALRYRMSFTDLNARFHLSDEVIEDEKPEANGEEPYFYYRYREGRPVIRVKIPTEETRVLLDIPKEDNNPDQSVLSQRQDPDVYPEIWRVQAMFGFMSFFRDLNLGRDAPVRAPQMPDLPQDYLLEDASNLSIVLNNLLNQPRAKYQILERMKDFYPSFQAVQSRVSEGRVQIFFEETGLIHNVPSTRLSDGSLRYLCLLALLCNPNRPRIIFIEEPEMGLHPDAIPEVAKLLKEASARSQIFVTTHSDILVDALTDVPEAVIVCEKHDGATHLRRLDADGLKPWLEKYRLGELWTRGEIGGNRW